MNVAAEIRDVVAALRRIVDYLETENADVPIPYVLNPEHARPPKPEVDDATKDLVLSILDERRSTTEIAKATGLAIEVVRGAVCALGAQDLIAHEGHGRGTKYFAVRAAS